MTNKQELWKAFKEFIASVLCLLAEKISPSEQVPPPTIAEEVLMWRVKEHPRKEELN
jgi:hypothetical protein